MESVSLFHIKENANPSCEKTAALLRKMEEKIKLRPDQSDDVIIPYKYKLVNLKKRKINIRDASGATCLSHQILVQV